MAVVLVVGGLGAAMLSGGTPDEVATASPVAAKETKNAAAQTPVAVFEKPTPAIQDHLLPEGSSARVVQKPPIESDQESTSTANTELSSTEPLAASNTVEPRMPTTDSDPAVAAAPGEEAGSPPKQVSSGSESARPAVLRFDPLDFDPSRLNLNTMPARADGEANSSIPPTALDEPGIPADDSDTLPEAADLSAVPDESPSVTVRLGPIARVESNPAQVARQFALRLEALSASMSLAQFMAFVSNLAEVPITIDPVALELAGVSPRAAVAVQMSGVTLEELAKAALSRQRLELVDRNGRMNIQLVKARERSVKRYDVSDLLPGSADASQFAHIVPRFVAPGTWQTSGGIGTIAIEDTKLRVDQTKDVHHEILIFCERWRLARGLAQRSQYPAKLLSIESPYPQVLDRLCEQTTFTFLPWTRLDDVMRHWEQATGLTILVDWSRLADAELTPSAPIACSAIDRTWDEALNELFETLGLAWWAVDRQTIQVTTRQALDTIERVEFYAMPEDIREQFADLEELVESLQSELQQHIGEKAGITPQIHVDAPSDQLIVRGSPTVHRYLTERLTSLSGD